MSRAANCGLDKSLFPSEFHFNEVATNLATSFLVITILFYIWNIGCLVFYTPPDPPARARRQQPGLAVNPLSALLAAVCGLVLIFATWPQPIEGAALLVVVLAQASTLGWQDHNPEHFLSGLVEKVPDVLSVIVTAYALGDVRKKYMELTGNTFYPNHDPKNQMIIAYFLAGAGFIGGFVQEMLISIETFNDGTIRTLSHVDCSVIFAHVYTYIGMGCSFMFLVIHAATTAAAIRFGATTIADGCPIFNTTKICAMVTLGLGAFYSLTISYVKVKQQRAN